MTTVEQLFIKQTQATIEIFSSALSIGLYGAVGVATGFLATLAFLIIGVSGESFSSGKKILGIPRDVLPIMTGFCVFSGATGACGLMAVYHLGYLLHGCYGYLSAAYAVSKL